MNRETCGEMIPHTVGMGMMVGWSREERTETQVFSSSTAAVTKVAKPPRGRQAQIEVDRLIYRLKHQTKQTKYMKRGRRKKRQFFIRCERVHRSVNVLITICMR